MKKRYLTIGASVLGAAAMAAGPALASGNAYTVSSGTYTSGDHDFTASSTGAVTFTVKHLATGNIVSMPCVGVDVPGTSGTAQVHDGTSIVDIATFDHSDWHTCHFGSIPLTVTQTSTWKIHGTGPVTSATTDIVAGHVHGITASVAANPAQLCSFDVDGPTPGAGDRGQADGTFDEATQTLNIDETNYTGHLKVYNVEGCAGAISDGDPAGFVGNISVAADNGPINLQ